MKIATIVGARPQFIKIGPLSKKLRHQHHEIIIHTGQHYDGNMSEIFFQQLEIPRPKYNLGIGSDRHGAQTGKMLNAIEEVLIKEKPDLVIVVGDTNSTLAGSLAAAKLQIPIAHIEAGLRSFQRSMPEEINRIITDCLATYLFCPTEQSIINLRREGITKNVFRVGDIMFDVLKYSIPIAEKKSNIISILSLKKGGYALVTCHRESNTNNKNNLSEIVQGLIDSHQLIVFPIHPRTKKFLKQYGLLKNLQNSSNIIITDPLSYFDMLVLQKNAAMVITDSGGMQKEAYLLQTPCITLRDETEWVETIQTGWNVVVGAKAKKIVHTLKNHRPKIKSYKKLYGNGDSSSKMVKILNAQ